MGKSMFRVCHGQRCSHKNKELVHGVIYGKDGVFWDASPPFYSQEAGLETLTGAIRRGYVLPEDKYDTERAIQNSELPLLETEADVDVSEDQLVKQCAAFAVLAMFGGGIDADTQRRMSEKSDALVRRREEIRSRNGG